MNIRADSGHTCYEYNEYIDLSKYTDSEIKILENCLIYIIGTELIKLKPSISIESIKTFKVNVGFELLNRGRVSTGGCKLENIRKEYINALACIMDYVKCELNAVDEKKKHYGFHCDELIDAYKLHKQRVVEGKDQDISKYYESILLMADIASVDEENNKIFSYSDINKYKSTLKELHKWFYKQFISSKVIKSTSNIVIDAIGGTAELLKINKLYYNFIVDNMLFSVLLSRKREVNKDYWEQLKFRYESLLIERAIENRNSYYDVRKIHALYMIRTNFLEVEALKGESDIQSLKEEAYNMYISTEMQELLKWINEPSTLSRSEFLSRLK